MSQYNYTKEIRSDQLAEEIRTSAITIAFDYISTLGTAVSIYFKAALSEAEEIILNGLVTDHVPVAPSQPIQEVAIVSNSVTRKDADSNLLVSVQPRLGSGVTLITHNYTDPCTWYINSVKITDEIATPNGTYDIYSLSKTNIIDTEHGRITFEDKLATNYKVIVKVNDVTKTIETDFTVNYEEGKITFLTPLTVNDEVKVTFYYATDSKFRIAASTGKKLKMEHVEVQFSKNLDLTNYNFWFDTYVYYGTGSQTLVSRSVYKNIKDWLNESNNKMSVAVPAMDCLTQDVFIFVWEYPVSRVLQNSLKTTLELYVKRKSDGAINVPIRTKTNTAGELAAGTFYCISESE